MAVHFAHAKWRLLVLLVAFQTMAVLETGHVVDATFYKSMYKHRRPYGDGGRPGIMNNPDGNQGFVKRPTRPDEEYQYGPDEIPLIYYS